VEVIVVAWPSTDEDLRTLKDIRPLHQLFLDRTKATEAVLAHLEGVPFTV